MIGLMERFFIFSNNLGKRRPYTPEEILSEYNLMGTWLDPNVIIHDNGNLLVKRKARPQITDELLLDFILT